jgi:hypothetical protein
MLPVALSNTSCKTTKTAIDSRITQGNHSAGFNKTADTVYIYCIDSVTVRMKGDTVFMDKIKKQFIYRIKSDTITQKDSIWVDRDVLVEREKGLSWLEQTQMKGFWFLLVILLLIIIYTLVKKRLKK